MHFSKKSGRLSSVGPEILDFGIAIPRRTFNQFYIPLHQTLSMRIQKIRNRSCEHSCYINQTDELFGTPGMTFKWRIQDHTRATSAALSLT